MTTDQKKKCKLIIHGAATSAGTVGAGMAQLPGTDSALIIPIQIAMVVALGAIFDEHITESAAKGAILGTAGTAIGRAVSQFLVGWIPFVGNAFNAATAFAITEAMGWAMADRFEKGEFHSKLHRG